MAYDPKAIEAKWHERWLNEGLFAAAESAPKKKMYVLDMFPYPSGDGLHVGHVKIYTASDVVSRYLRMKGFNVLHPTGWDAFGLPTENSAIKKNIHPAELTKQNVDRFRQQMQSMGLSYDWDREVNTSDPNYYKWTQWIFLQLFRMKLAYEANIPINWCPSCKTGLANEEVIDGKCERCGTAVEEKPMRQWMLRITKYADQLLEGLSGLDWPKPIKDLQTNWIGRSEGAAIVFDIVDNADVRQLGVFTTRPDTLFGATYIVLSPHHPDVFKLTSHDRHKEVEVYIKEAQKPIRLNPEAEKEKTGVFTGAYAINPVNDQRIPIWVANYVLMEYGSGAIMAVPAHDERDFDFARRYELPIQQVVVPEVAADESALPYTGKGRLINSGQYDGQESSEASGAIVQKLQLTKRAKKAVNYKLRDWVFSRQRYWGEPIPIIHCEQCGTVPVPEQDLPVQLPPLDDFRPTGTGQSPLAKAKDWVNVKCPSCAGMGTRETNTMPQWAGSSWYWLRYTSPNFADGIADKQAMQQWLPVDLYVGGAEHAVLHLLYARFWQKALYDAGAVTHTEPFERFRAVGLVLGEDGEKMSKSRGNVINPDTVVAEHGADTLRVYAMFMGPFENAIPWSTESIKGARRFLDRVWKFIAEKREAVSETQDEETSLILHQTIRRVSESTEQFKFNTAISALMELLNVLEKKSVTLHTLESFVLMLAPYAPHVAEELWEALGHGQSLMYQPWPAFDEKLIAGADVTIPVQVNGKVRGELTLPVNTLQVIVEQQARALTNVAKHLEGKNIGKVIYVQDKLLNFVVSG